MSNTHGALGIGRLFCTTGGGDGLVMAVGLEFKIELGLI
jgi:hypothetical protein